MITYSELLQKHTNNKHLSYSELLETFEWKAKRNEILIRDNHICTNCKKTSTVLSHNKEVCLQNIEFDKKGYPVVNQIGVKSFKEMIGCHTVDICAIRKEANQLFGISDNGILFAVDASLTCDSVVNTNEFSIHLFEIDGYVTPCIALTNSIVKGILIPRFCSEKLSLNIHHKCYIQERLPWEYDDQDLTTVCNSCHWNIHQNSEIPTYRDISGVLIPIRLVKCIKCNGAGFLPQYNHVENGVCFKCMGKKYFELLHPL